jgi:hypothetical protein
MLAMARSTGARMALICVLYCFCVSVSSPPASLISARIPTR